MRLALAICVIVGLLVAFAAPAAAADFRSGDVVTIGANETINDDLYFGGNTLTILGTVRGDVVAAGSSLTIDGNVTGSVMAAAGSVTVRGQVGGSVRAAGNAVTVDGRVSGDVVAFGTDLTVGAGARIGRDLILGGVTVNVGGEVGRDVRGGATTLTIDGHVGRDVGVEVETLRLTGRAVIDGAVSYASATEAIQASGATVRGGIQRREPQRREPGAAGPANALFDWLRALVGMLALGFLLLLIAPRFLVRASERATRSPAASLGFGLAVLVGVPIAAILAFILGALVGGWWIGLVALALYLVAIAISLPVVGLAVGEWILRRAGRPVQTPLALAVGIVVLVLISVVPVVGGLASFCVALVGLGAMTLAAGAGRDAPAAAASS